MAFGCFRLWANLLHLPHTDELLKKSLNATGQ
uniref:Uncharacterized protein n=1 Tax=Anguilla anguilla TaxID=7936 RepID=A0A0E9PTV8_ANGAN